jgi:hypothetical protein
VAGPRETRPEGNAGKEHIGSRAVFPPVSSGQPDDDRVQSRLLPDLPDHSLVGRLIVLEPTPGQIPGVFLAGFDEEDGIPPADDGEGRVLFRHLSLQGEYAPKEPMRVKKMGSS